MVLMGNQSLTDPMLTKISAAILVSIGSGIDLATMSVIRP